MIYANYHSMIILLFLATNICSIAWAANDSRWQIALEPHIKVFSCSAAWWMISLIDSCFRPSILMKPCKSSRRMVWPSMQLTSRSQNLSRMRLSWSGVCSLKIICMMSFTSFLQGDSMPSGFLVQREACSWMRAERRLLSQFLAMLEQVSEVNTKLLKALVSILPTSASACTMESWSGAGMRRLRQRERIGLMSLCRLLQMRIILQFLTYFSMVLLSPPCASLVSLSASLMMSTLKPRPLLASMLLLEAISFTTFWMIWRSLWSLSDGVISMWQLLVKILYQMVVDVPSGFRTRSSSFSLKTCSPQILARKAQALVFLPAPSGPQKIICCIA